MDPGDDNLEQMLRMLQSNSSTLASIKNSAISYFAQDEIGNDTENARRAPPKASPAILLEDQGGGTAAVSRAPPANEKKHQQNAEPVARQQYAPLKPMSLRGRSPKDRLAGLQNQYEEQESQRFASIRPANPSLFAQSGENQVPDAEEIFPMDDFGAQHADSLSDGCVSYSRRYDDDDEVGPVEQFRGFFKHRQRVPLYEDLYTEFKEFAVWDSSRKSMIEQKVCGMLNRNGGSLFIGINDHGSVVGVSMPFQKRDTFAVDILNTFRQCRPPIEQPVLEIFFHNVVKLHGAEVPDLYVVQLRLRPPPGRTFLYFNSLNMLFVRNYSSNFEYRGENMVKFIHHMAKVWAGRENRKKKPPKVLLNALRDIQQQHI